MTMTEQGDPSVEAQVTADLDLAMDAHTNGGGSVELMPPNPRAAARAAAIHAGMRETQALFAERDAWRDRYQIEHQRVLDLEAAIEKAREDERIHVQKVVQESIAIGRRSEAEKEVLEGELSSMRQRMAEADAAHRAALQRVGELEAYCDIVMAATQKVRHPDDQH
jgi:hypothetical protein